MVLLCVVFGFILVLTFSVVALATRPTREAVQVQRRFSGLRLVNGKTKATITNVEEYLASPGSQAFAWVEKLVAHVSLSERLRLLLLQSDNEKTVGNFVFVCAMVAATAFVATYVISSMLFIAVIAGVAAGYVPVGVLSFQRSRRLYAFEKELPQCIEMSVRALRAGYSIAAAINIAAEQASGPAKEEFAEVFKKQNYGLPLRDALLQMLERVPSADLRVLVTGILVQKDTGGNLAELMERVAAVIRERVRIQGVIRVNTAQGRLTGWILCLLPIVMLLLLNLLNPGYSKVLFTDPFGKDLLYAGVGLLLLGGYLIRQIVNGIEV